MEVIFGLVALLFVIGIALAMYERRKGLRWQDDRTAQHQTETERDALRAEDSFRQP